MSYPQQVKEIAYEIDPECWVSYSGKPKAYKSAMDARRTAALRQASEQWDDGVPELRCGDCGRRVEHGTNDKVEFVICGPCGSMYGW